MIQVSSFVLPVILNQFIQLNLFPNPLFTFPAVRFLGRRNLGPFFAKTRRYRRLSLISVK